MTTNTRQITDSVSIDQLAHIHGGSAWGACKAGAFVTGPTFGFLAGMAGRASGNGDPVGTAIFAGGGTVAGLVAGCLFGVTGRGLAKAVD